MASARAGAAAIPSASADRRLVGHPQGAADVAFKEGVGEQLRLSEAAVPPVAVGVAHQLALAHYKAAQVGGHRLELILADEIEGGALIAATTGSPELWLALMNSRVL